MSFRISLRFLFVLAGLGALIPGLHAAATTKTRVLIVDGYGNHDWRRTTHYIRLILDR